MREIKFRAWNKEEKEMFVPECVEGMTINKYFNDCDGWCVFMQYTGLKDRKGKEIYDGDVLQVTKGTNYEKDGSDMRLIVRWHDGECETGFKLFYAIYDEDAEEICEQESGNVLFHRLSVEESGLEVIGNVWENPTLLTQYER